MGELLRLHPGRVLAATFGVVACFALYYIATAFALKETEVVVVTWDQDLGRAAESTGLAVAGVVDR